MKPQSTVFALLNLKSNRIHGLGVRLGDAEESGKEGAQVTLALLPGEGTAEALFRPLGCSTCVTLSCACEA